MPKICDFETCRSQASYGEFYNKPLRCKKHKEDYKLVHNLCKNGNCSNLSYYNYFGETVGSYCSVHKLNEMVDIRRKLCKGDNCTKQPAFNYPGEKQMYCYIHKNDGMINVLTQKCKETNCDKIPVYNFLNEKTAIYCKSHKKENMVNIKARKCLDENCKLQPNYNFKNLSKGIYCSKHKKEGMVNVTINKCNEENCEKVPSCNFPNETKRIYCSEHKKEGMISLTNNMCNYDSCNKTSTYNYIFEKQPIYCKSHKLDNMVDVVHDKCKSEACFGNRGNSKYKGYCCFCYQHLFPTDPLTLQVRSKTKEIAIRDFINLNFEGFHHDTPLWTGNCECTHRRKIDHRKLIGNTLLCIETDEHQHKYYDEKKEELRYDDLFMIHGGKFIFVRFNPDKFKDKNGKVVNPMLYTRLPTLKSEIEKQIKRIENDENKELLEIIKIYYDEI